MIWRDGKCWVIILMVRWCDSKKYTLRIMRCKPAGSDHFVKMRWKRKKKMRKKIGWIAIWGLGTVSFLQLLFFFSGLRLLFFFYFCLSASLDFLSFISQWIFFFWWVSRPLLLCAYPIRLLLLLRCASLLSLSPFCSSNSWFIRRFFGIKNDATTSNYWCNCYKAIRYLNYDVISSCKLGNFVCFVNFEDHFLLKSSGVFFFCSLFVSENTCFNFDRLYWLLG